MSKIILLRNVFEISAMYEVKLEIILTLESRFLTSAFTSAELRFKKAQMRFIGFADE